MHSPGVRSTGTYRALEVTPSAGAATQARRAPQLRFVAAVALRFDSPLSVGATPDGVRFDFQVHGTVQGPELNGKFPPCAAYLLIDPDGIGTIQVRAPLLLDDGAIAELEATGRYDFGKDGYEQAVRGILPNSALGWCPRFLTGDPRYLWLNRALCLGVGELRPLEARVDYDLFVMTPSTSLYERLGGRENIDRIMSAFIDALHHSPQLNRQNRNIQVALQGVNPAALKRKVSDLVSELTGGPDRYFGRPLKAAHAHLQITESDWKIAVVELRKILAEHRVNAQDQEEFLGYIANSKADIVLPSLYERLGKREGIFKLMSASVDSLDKNEQLLRQNPKLAGMGHGDLSGIKQQATDFICSLTGGPCVYSGRTMKASHAHLDLTEADWSLFWEDTRRLLNEHGVPRREQEELLELMATTKSDIVQPS